MKKARPRGAVGPMHFFKSGTHQLGLVASGLVPSDLVVELPQPITTVTRVNARMRAINFFTGTVLSK